MVFIIALGQVYYVQLRIAVIIRKCFSPLTSTAKANSVCVCVAAGVMCMPVHRWKSLSSIEQ